MIYLYIGQKSCGLDQMVEDTPINRRRLANAAMNAAIYKGLQVVWSRDLIPPPAPATHIVIPGL